MKKGAKILIIILSLIIFGLLTDPDADLIKSLPFGSELILYTGIGLVILFIIAVIEFVPDMFIGKKGVKDQMLEQTASYDSKASAMIYIGRSIRVFAYALVAMAVLGFMR